MLILTVSRGLNPMLPGLNIFHACCTKPPPPATMVMVAGGGWNRRKSHQISTNITLCLTAARKTENPLNSALAALTSRLT